MLDIEEVDEHINYDSAAAELAFTKGVSRRGRAYLDEVSQSIVRDPDLTTKEKNAIRAAFDNLSEVVADGKGESYSQVTLNELDVYGLSDHLIEKIGFLVFDRENNVDRSPPLHRSPRTSGGGNGGKNKRESVESGIQSQISMDEEYEDDFETSDETYSTYSDKERRQSGLQSQVGRVSPTYYQHTQQQQQVFSSKQNRENRVRGGERQEIEQNYVREPDLYGDTGIAVSNGSDGGVVGTGLCGPNPFQNILQGTPSSYNGGTGAGQEYIPNVMSRSVDLEKDSSDSDDDYGDASYEGEYSDSDYYYSEEEEDYGDNDDAEREYADDFGDNSLASEAVGNVTEQSPIKGIAPSTSVGNVHDGTPNDSLLSANVSPLKQSEPDKKNNGKRRRRRKKKNPSWIDKQRWTRGEKIGSGSFGDVYQGMNDFGRLFAVKQLLISLSKPETIKELQNEVEIISGLSHRNIVGYLGAKIDARLQVVNIFQEWVPGGSVAHLLKRFGAFTQHVVANYTRQILMGLSFLHSNDIIHRDIKGGNVLVDEAGTVKLADFGASTKTSALGEKSGHELHGTPYFMAPEVLSHSKYSRAGDIWSVGCTMIQMLTTQPPWKDHNLQNIVLLHQLLEGWSGPPKYPHSQVSQQCRDVIEACFQKDSHSRPSADALLLYPWIVAVESHLDDSGLVKGDMSVNSEEGGSVYSLDGRRGGSLLDGEGSVESVGAQLGAMLKERLSIQDLGNARQSAAPSNPGGGDESLLNSINREGEGDTALMMGKLQSRQIGKRQVSDPGVAPPSMVGAVDIAIPQSYTELQAHPGSVLPNPYAKGSGAQIIGSGLSRDTSSTTKDSDDSNVLPPPAVPLPQERGGGNIQNIYAHRSPHPPPSKHFDHPSNHGGGRTAGGSGNSVVSQSQALSTPRDTGRDDHRPGRSHTTPALNKSSTPPRSGTSGGGATDGWGCRVCGAANASDLEYCESCAHMRGSMGRKGSDQPIHRR